MLQASLSLLRACSPHPTPTPIRFIVPNVLPKSTLQAFLNLSLARDSYVVKGIFYQYLLNIFNRLYLVFHKHHLDVEAGPQLR